MVDVMTCALGGSMPPGLEWNPTGNPLELIWPSKMWVMLTGGSVGLQWSWGIGLAGERAHVAAMARTASIIHRRRIIADLRWLNHWGRESDPGGRQRGSW